MRVEIKGKILLLDSGKVGIYDSNSGKLMLDCSLVTEGVAKEHEWKIDWNLEEVQKLVNSEFNSVNWSMFKLRRVMIGR